MQKRAHHYDLRGTHPDNTDEVKNVRRQEKETHNEWIPNAKTTRVKLFLMFHILCV
ncbi:hypothetical protein KIN20_030343 [Parelaphostrongylus tenuis]|uniref:Uncharacterized protein n=1 Tax=Parelaphostrongylus tenuis TaxID=148309 RepID=A0AAD5WGE2_PARTN|nr:hypothetical protein KIN20_030343 [Parelaphostrongylus tenuis]